MAKYLMGVVLAGHSKDYIVPKFLEMLEHVVYPDKNVDIAFAVDETLIELTWPQLKWHTQITVPRMAGSMWATEIVYYGKQALIKYATEKGYDAFIHQGIDCLYEDPDSFQRLKRTYEQYGGMVGALVAGRNRPDYPVCRDFVHKDGKVTREQEENKVIADHVQTSPGPLMVYGYPGSDATFVSTELLRTVSMKGYEHWHNRPNKDQPLGELGPEEWFVYSMIKSNREYPLVDTRVRPWHVHENLMASRYPSQYIHLDSVIYSQ